MDLWLNTAHHICLFTLNVSHTCCYTDISKLYAVLGEYVCRTYDPVHIVVFVARRLERLTGDKKIAGSIRVWGSENVSEFAIELECGHRQQSTDGLKNCVIYTIKMLLKMLFV